MSGILALDLGTKTGWALSENGRIESGVQTFDLGRGDSRGMRYVRFSRWLSEFWTRGATGDVEALAWAAGFFDGEGSIGCHRTMPKKYEKTDGTTSEYEQSQVRVQITQTGSAELLERFAAAVGAGKVYGPHATSGLGKGPAWHYIAAGTEVSRDIGLKLWPWLGSRKREQVERAIDKKLLSRTRFPAPAPRGLIVYEAPHHRGGAATEVANGFSTHVQEFCARYGIEHAAIHSATLKKFTTGSGRAEKGAMAFHAAERGWITGPTDDNEVDAICLLHYALSELVPASAAGPARDTEA